MKNLDCNSTSVKQIIFLTLLRNLGVFVNCAFSQQELLELDGAIQISNSLDPTPDPGTIRWTGTDFEGRTNNEWKSLTTPDLQNPNIVVDIDGNIYDAIIIGAQTWMRENLRTSRYNDGTPLPEKTFDDDWNTQEPARSSYENNIKWDAVQGKLYNWYSVDPVSTEGKNICPLGWHIPFDSELNTLASFLGGATVAAVKMKEIGPEHWGPNNTATNESGFTAKLSGYRHSFGPYGIEAFAAIFWSQSEHTAENGTSYFVNDSDILKIAGANKNWGHSVRCVKD